MRDLDGGAVLVAHGVEPHDAVAAGVDHLQPVAHGETVLGLDLGVLVGQLVRLAFQFGASIFGAVALLAAMVLQLGWDGVSVVSTQIPPWAIAAVIASGILSAVTFLLIALAFTLAQASLLAPFQYLEILGATILGYLVFGDMPDLLTIIGTLIVLGSGLYVFHREGKARVPSRKIRARSDR